MNCIVVLYTSGLWYTFTANGKPFFFEVIKLSHHKITFIAVLLGQSHKIKFIVVGSNKLFNPQALHTKQFDFSVWEFLCENQVFCIWNAIEKTVKY